MFIILKHSIDTVKAETDVSIDNEEDVIDMETDAVCVPQECETELSYFLSCFCSGVKFYSHQLIHFLIQICAGLLSYIKST